LIVRSKDYFDNATPSGNNVAADVLLRLSILTGNDDYRQRAATVLRILGEPLMRYPSAFGRALCALDFIFRHRRRLLSSASGMRRIRGSLRVKCGRDFAEQDRRASCRT
jgi:uncharacterized protein YyaL (SSP411 family)